MLAPPIQHPSGELIVFPSRTEMDITDFSLCCTTRVVSRTGLNGLKLLWQARGVLKAKVPEVLKVSGCGSSYRFGSFVDKHIV
jgi:hypothetical protein